MPVAVVPDPKPTPWQPPSGLRWEARPSRTERASPGAVSCWLLPWLFACTSDPAQGPVFGEEKSPQLVSCVAHAV